MSAEDGLAPPRRRRRVPRPGLRPRLLLVVGGLLALGFVAGGLTVRQVLLDRVDDRVAAELDQETAEFRRLATRGIDPDSGRRLAGDVRRLLRVSLRRNFPDEGESFFTYVEGRRYLTTARPDPEPPLLAALDSLVARDSTSPRRGELSAAGDRVGYVVVPVRSPGEPPATFIVTEDVSAPRAEVNRAFAAAAPVALIALLVSIAVAYALLTRVLKPLRDLEATARAITDTDLTRRIAVRGNDEVAQLGETFNAMLDRLQAAFASQRRLVSDAGHELRTPITIVRGHLELLGDDPAERRETIALVTDELDRMGRLVDDLLTLAKAERDDFLRPSDTDVDVLTDELLDKARALGDREWTLDARATGRVRVDRQRLTQAVVALADNAVRHTEPGQVVALGSALAGGRLRLWVRDDGPGVDDDDRELIFDRFARGSTPRGEGTGLGLAIVGAIATAHGGSVRLRDRSTFELDLPDSVP